MATKVVKEIGNFIIKAKDQSDLIQVGLELPPPITAIKVSVVADTHPIPQIRTRLCSWCKTGIQTVVRAPTGSKNFGVWFCWRCKHHDFIPLRTLISKPSNAWEERRLSNIAYAFPSRTGIKT
jgi:hypothetical protein